MNKLVKVTGDLPVHYLPHLVLELDPVSEMLLLKTSNQLVVSVPPGCTLSIENKPVNGKVLLTVEGDLNPYLGALTVNNRPVTTDLINP